MPLSSKSQSKDYAALVGCRSIRASPPKSLTATGMSEPLRRFCTRIARFGQVAHHSPSQDTPLGIEFLGGTGLVHGRFPALPA